MNKSMLAGIGIGVAAALGVAAVAGLNVLDRGPQYAQVVSSTPIKESIKTPRKECRNVTVTHRRPVQDENRIAGSVLGAVAGGVIGHQFGGGRGRRRTDDQSPRRPLRLRLNRRYGFHPAPGDDE